MTLAPARKREGTEILFLVLARKLERLLSPKRSVPILMLPTRVSVAVRGKVHVHGHAKGGAEIPFLIPELALERLLSP